MRENYELCNLHMVTLCALPKPDSWCGVGFAVAVVSAEVCISIPIAGDTTTQLGDSDAVLDFIAYLWNTCMIHKMINAGLLAT